MWHKKFIHLVHLPILLILFNCLYLVWQERKLQGYYERVWRKEEQLIPKTFESKNDAFERLSDVRFHELTARTNNNSAVLTSKKDHRIAVFIQFGSESLSTDILACATNAAAAAVLLKLNNVDFYVSIATEGRQELLASIRQELEHIVMDGEVFVYSSVSNIEAVQFLELLYEEYTKREKNSVYDVILKIHSSADTHLRERALESLCGTREQVVSVINQFELDPMLDMIAPMGTFSGPMSNISAALHRNINERSRNFTRELDEYNYPRRFGLSSNPRNLKGEKASFVLGNMFWSRYKSLRLDNLFSRHHSLSSILDDYTSNVDVQFELQYHFPTQISISQRKVGEIPPCPRIVAMYFPQFHPIPENDKFWGQGFTEWTILEPLALPGIRKPLPTSEGGLGYYNLLSKDVRQRQGEMARQAGVNGFIYYHYWFSGPGAPVEHVVMPKVPQHVINDGEPNLPFALSWANEPWLHRWDAHNATGQSIIDQNYGNEDEWREHFEYLLEYFNHPNYIRIHDEPLFIIYRVGHFGSKLKPMLDLWRRLASDAGLAGIHFVNTVNNYRLSDKKTVEIEKSAKLKRAFHFWPLYKRSGFPSRITKTYTSSNGDFESLAETYPVQYWGAFAGFDRRPRAPKAKPDVRSAKEFNMGLDCSFQNMAIFRERDIQRNLYFVTAWNEWNEQAVLEPDNVRKFSHLMTISLRLSNIPVFVVSTTAKETENTRGQVLKHLCFPEKDNSPTPNSTTY